MSAQGIRTKVRSRAPSTTGAGAASTSSRRSTISSASLPPARSTPSFRPCIVVVEATRQRAQEENDAEWEGLILGGGYGFVWLDGHNRFLVAGERHAGLAQFFRTPPNTFDDFIRATDTEYASRIIAANNEALAAAARAAAAAERTLAAEQRALAAEQMAPAPEQRALPARPMAAA